jgi:organic radical activating enzyme
MAKTIITAGDKNYKMLHFDWFFTDWCNYACSYCSAAVKMSESFSKQTSPAKYKIVLAKLQMIKTDFMVELLGGEPTLHPNLHDVVEALCNMQYCKEVELITNLSRSLAFFEKLNKLEFNKLRVLASYHPEYFTQEFIEKCAAMAKMEHIGFMVNVNLSTNPKDWPSLISLIEQLQTNNVHYGFNFLNSTPTWNHTYSEEFFQTFDKYLVGRQKDNFVYTFSDGTTETLNESKIVEMKYNKFNGYKCTPLIYQIDSDGTIYNFCTKRVVPITMQVADLIKEETCPLSKCPCDIMYNFYKEK